MEGLLYQYSAELVGGHPQQMSSDMCGEGMVAPGGGGGGAPCGRLGAPSVLFLPHMAEFSMSGQLMGTLGLFCMNPNQEISMGALEARTTCSKSSCFIEVSVMSLDCLVAVAVGPSGS